MDRPVATDGYYIDASDLNFLSTTVETEMRERLLAVTNGGYGISSGLIIGDSSVSGQARVSVAPGVAYDNSGYRVYLGATTEVSIALSDAGKYVVIERGSPTEDTVAHPKTGAVTTSRLTYDSPVVSVVSGASAGQVKIAKIDSILTDAVIPQVVLLSDGASRDVIKRESPVPYVIVGPAGDKLADYSGDDATPFNDAISYLKSSTNGGVVYVRPGSWSVTPLNPITADGLDSLIVVGSGEGSQITVSPGTVGQFSNIGSLQLDSLKFVGTGAVAISSTSSPRFYLRDIDKFHLVNSQLNSVSHYVPQVYFVSGVGVSTLRDNEWSTVYSGSGQEYISALWGDESYVHSNAIVSVQNNSFSRVGLFYNGSFESIKAFGNTFASGSFGFGSYSMPATVAPSTLMFVGNHMQFATWERVFSSVTSGAVISNNIFAGTDRGISIGTVSRGGVSDGTWGHFTIFSNNVVEGGSNSWIGTSCLDLGSPGGPIMSGVIVKGNVFKRRSDVFVPASWGITAYNLVDSIVDTNIFYNLFDHFVTGGGTVTGVWVTSGVNNTSNKVI